MDIFRKKKIRKLLNELEDVNNILIQERCKTTKLQERINNLEKISTQTLEENQILMGFPHPSGANVNRLVQLEQNKEEMINFLKKRTVS